MVKIVQTVRCSRCKRRFEVEVKTLEPLPPKWRCGKDDCERVKMVRQNSGDTMTARAYVDAAPSHSKYHNVKTSLDGITFDSGKEAKRYAELKLMHKAGNISNLIRQPRYEIAVNGEPICAYIGDFQYVILGDTENPPVIVVEDVKGVRTPEFKLKKKLMKAVHGIDVVEI